MNHADRMDMILVCPRQCDCCVADLQTSTSSILIQDAQIDWCGELYFQTLWFGLGCGMRLKLSTKASF